VIVVGVIPIDSPAPDDAPVVAAVVADDAEVVVTEVWEELPHDAAVKPSAATAANEPLRQSFLCI
jgi:hypothetical protein